MPIPPHIQKKLDEDRERDYYKHRYRYDPEFMKMLEEEEREEQDKSSKEHGKK